MSVDAIHESTRVDIPVMITATRLSHSMRPHLQPAQEPLKLKMQRPLHPKQMKPIIEKSTTHQTHSAQPKKSVLSQPKYEKATRGGCQDASAFLRVGTLPAQLEAFVKGDLPTTSFADQRYMGHSHFTERPSMALTYRSQMERHRQAWNDVVNTASKIEELKYAPLPTAAAPVRSMYKTGFRYKGKESLMATNKEPLVRTNDEQSLVEARKRYNTFVPRKEDLFNYTARSMPEVSQCGMTSEYRESISARAAGYSHLDSGYHTGYEFTTSLLAKKKPNLSRSLSVDRQHTLSKSCSWAYSAVKNQKNSRNQTAPATVNLSVDFEVGRPTKAAAKASESPRLPPGDGELFNRSLKDMTRTLSMSLRPAESTSTRVTPKKEKEITGSAFKPLQTHFLSTTNLMHHTLPTQMRHEAQLNATRGQRTPRRVSEFLFDPKGLTQSAKKPSIRF